jgi:OOP family OmpA-OmpF porin
VGTIGAALQVSLNSAVLFDTDKYDLKPEARQELAHVVDLIRQQPNGSVLVEGHTDATGSEAHNQTLSENRARSVRDYLEAQTQGAGVRFSSRGYGKSRPIASNDTEAGRAKNRRVEIIIVPAGATPANSSR